MESRVSIKEADQLAAARNGSREALGELLNSFRGYLLLVANEELDRDVQSKAGASDLLQDTFFEAHRDFQQFAGSTKAELQRWLRRILLNNVANFRRKYRNGAKRLVTREVSLNVEGEGPDFAVQLAANGTSPSGHVSRDEEKKVIEQALARLPERYRRAIELRQREQCSFAEIGAALACSSEAARKLWVRGLQRLARELAHSHGVQEL